MELDTIVCGDCLDVMRDMPADSIDLIITSPPYNCGKEYGIYDDSRTWPEYWGLMLSVFQESCRLLIDGGRMAVNIPWWIGKKPRRFAMVEFYQNALTSGLIFIDKIIWIKGNENGVRGDLGTGWGTWLSPSGPSIRCASEPILVFAKKHRGRRVVTGEGRGKCLVGDMSKNEFLENTTDVWFIQGQGDKDHPAVFPVELPERLIKLYSWPDELVFDPFMGLGTTAEAALKTNRHWHGCDIDPEYVKLANQRIEKTRLEMSQMELSL